MSGYNFRHFYYYDLLEEFILLDLPTLFSFFIFLVLESIEYIRKWNGVCFDGQHSKETIQEKTEKQCKQKCNSETSCTGYATHSNTYCYLTYNTKFDFSDFSILQKYTCYEKVPGILQ